MARITVEDCLEKVDNQYDLVLLILIRKSVEPIRLSN